MENLNVEICERKDAPGVWAVEALNLQGDGECYLTLFSGPNAKGRAIEYRDWKYG